MGRRVDMSRYAQARLSVTVETRGVAYYRLYMKPTFGDWTERHCVAQGRVDAALPRSEEEMLSVLAAVLMEHLIL